MSRKWSQTRRGKYVTRRGRQFAKYHKTTGPIVGAAGVAVGAAFASYYGGATAGAAVTAAGAGVAYAGGSYWGATAARGEGKSGSEAREEGRKVGRRAAIYAGIGGGVGTVGGSLASYMGAGSGASAYNTGETAEFAGGAAEGEAGEVAALGKGAGTTELVAAEATAPGWESALIGENTLKVLGGAYNAYQGMQAGGKAGPEAGAMDFGPPMGGGGGGGGAGDPEEDPFGPGKPKGPEVSNSKAILMLAGLAVLLFR